MQPLVAMDATPRVVAVTASYRRMPELARLLASLSTEQPLLAGVVVVDNAHEPSLDQVIASAAVPTRVITLWENLGRGGGVAFGLREVFREPGVTHAWICDDDSMAAPGALASMLQAMASEHAEAAVPLIADAQGRLGWFPGPLPQPARDAIRRRGQTGGGFRSECGDTPLRWDWSPWTSLLVSRRAAKKVGLPREDFWFQGEDFEWTLRITHRFSGVLVPSALCLHCPPTASGDPVKHAARERLKALAMIQNSVFTATRLPYGRRLLRHIPGNCFRFLRSQRDRRKAIEDVFIALWFGAIRGLPAGKIGADRWRREWEQ
ncbi:MAG: glycosyltransferase [Opitutaceae bacterium]|jgi:GT2 family glycosyltransferase